MRLLGPATINLPRLGSARRCATSRGFLNHWMREAAISFPVAVWPLDRSPGGDWCLQPETRQMHDQGRLGDGHPNLLSGQ